MDLIEIKHDYLARNTDGNYFIHWLIYDWRVCLFKFFIDEQIVPFPRTCFTVGDDHIELYDCFFMQDPHAFIHPRIKGRLMTLVMHAKFTVMNTLIQGKMCIRNPKKSPLIAEFEIRLKTAEMIQTVGFIISGDSLCHNVCLYEFIKYDVSLTYDSGSKQVSVLDTETDASKSNLLKKYLVEIITKDACLLIQEYEEQRLAVKQTVSELCGNNYEFRDILRNHNRVIHAAMRNLADHIINLTNDLIEQKSKKVHFPRIYGLDRKKNLKVYEAYIDTLYSLAFEQVRRHRNEEVIISKQDDCVIIYVPVRFWELALHYKEVNDESDSNGQFEKKQLFMSDKAHFTLTLKKKEEDQVEFKILEFRIMHFSPVGNAHPIEMSMDYLVSFPIEEFMKSTIEQTFKDKKLQELAVNPTIHVEDDGDNLYDSDHEEDVAND